MEIAVDISGPSDGEDVADYVVIALRMGYKCSLKLSASKKDLSNSSND